VREYHQRRLDITNPPGVRCFGGGDIKRAVRPAKSNIGERLMSSHAPTKNPLLGWDNLPFGATNLCR